MPKVAIIFNFTRFSNPVFAITASWTASIETPIKSLQLFDAFSYNPLSVLLLESSCFSWKCQFSSLFFAAILKLNFRNNYCLLHFHHGIFNSFSWEASELIDHQNCDLPSYHDRSKVPENCCWSFFPRYSRSILTMTTRRITSVKIPISRALLQKDFSLSLWHFSCFMWALMCENVRMQSTFTISLALHTSLLLSFKCSIDNLETNQQGNLWLWSSPRYAHVPKQLSFALVSICSDIQFPP